MMYKFCFVILHYISYESTSACVDSIINTYALTNASLDIIVVDNASPNKSFTQLQEQFAAHEYIHWIHSDKNLGFAGGNNLGYLYALNTLKSDFIIIANNDTVFTQPDFLQVLSSCYEAQCPHPALIGPDIRNADQFHQSPYREHIITDPEITRWMRNRRLWTVFLYADKYLHLSRHLKLFRNYYTKRTAAGKPNTSWAVPAINAVLQGACIIFTPTFTEHFTEYAFYPDTFMYCEEDIIAYLCVSKGLQTFYTPNLYMTHLEAISTALSTGESAIDKELFLSKNILKSLKIFKRIRKNTEISKQQ